MFSANRKGISERKREREQEKKEIERTRGRGGVVAGLVWDAGIFQLRLQLRLEVDPMVHPGTGGG